MASEQLIIPSADGATPDLHTQVIGPFTPLPSGCLTFRLSEIPLDIDKSALSQGLDSLQVGTALIQGNSKVCSLAIYLSWQVATVSFHHVPDEFDKCKPGDRRPLQLPKRQVVTVLSHQKPDRNNRYDPDHGARSGSTEGQVGIRAVPVSVMIDRDFYGMTPLYQPVGATAEYDVIAVTGLSAHAFGSWKAPQQADRMWLRDFLPQDCPNMRVHTWGYYSSIVDDRSTTSITAISRKFLGDIKRVRENQAVSRPLILIGHSLGGLVVQKALVDASKGNCEQDKAVYESCVGILFFGVPIKGLNRTSIESLVQGKGNDYFLQSISSGSEYLSDLEIDFGICYGSMRNCIISSFYETVDTLSVTKTPNGRFERTGPPIRMVPQESAQCSLSADGNRIGICADHSKMVKFQCKSDDNYIRVIDKIKDITKLPRIGGPLPAQKKQSEIVEDVQETQKKILSIMQNTNRIAKDQEMESLLQWISPLEPQTRHQDVRSKRLESIGNWLLESEIFQNWRDDSDGVNIFGCYGIPGAGKTFITSLVIDHLGGLAGGKISITFIYCDYNNAKEQSPVNMIGGLLKQAITASKEVSTDIIDTLLEKKKSRQAIEVKDAVHSLSRLLNGFDKTYICIDALDECNETDRRQLIQSLVELSSPSHGNESRPIRLFFTGRPPMEKYVISHTSVVPEIPLMVKLQASTEDITAYIAQKIDDDKTVGMDDDFKKHIVEAIVSASKGMFLLPALQIAAVLDEPTIRKRREALKDLPRELYDAFAITLDRIRAQKKSMSSLAMKVLKWTFLSVRPLSLEELRYALAIEPGDIELDRDNFVAPQFILDCCLGLVIVDESTSTVRLVHKSLQDYFQDQYDEGSLFNDGHMEIASVCMTYMSFHHLDEEKPIVGSEIADRYPLLGYAAYRWDYHLRSSKTRNPHVEDMAFNLVTEKYTSQLAPKAFLTSRIDDESWYAMGSEDWLLDTFWSKSISEILSTETFPLHIAASTGSPELFCRVLNSRNGDINEMDAWGNYVLTLSARFGHVAVIKLILQPQYKADVNVEATFSETALLLASKDGHTEVVKLLLKTNGIDVNKANIFGNTPLFSAAQMGHSDVVKLLLETNGVDVNKASSVGNTPLLSAAQMGHSDVVQLLLEKNDVDVNGANSHGDTPLSVALRFGHFEVVRLLLKTNGVDVNKADSDGDTPLFFATQRGHLELVKLLLEKNGVDVNKASKSGNTPLLDAVRNGQLEVVKLLLETNGVDVNKADSDGDTPLFFATQRGHLELVKLLLEKNGVDVNKASKSGNTPLLDAVRNGQLEVVKLLLEKNGVDVNKASKSGNTPLLDAVRNGQLEVVKLLLETNGVDVNKADSDGDTPLFFATQRGHSEVVKLLLETNGVDVNKASDDGNTPLLVAAFYGHSEVVKLLLETNGVDVIQADYHGVTPLLSAAYHGHSEVVKLLLEKNGVDVDQADKDGDTPLIFAARRGHSEVMNMLIQHGAAVETRNNKGRTALSLAAQHHHLKTLNILLQHSTNVNTTDGIYGRTPLIWSFYDPWAWEERVDYHNCDILKALLSQPDIDVNWRAKNGSTALSGAIECQLHDVEELLRAHGAV